MATETETERILERVRQKIRVKQAARDIRARVDANAYAETVMKDNHGVYLLQAPFHREWHELAKQYNRLIILAPRGHGKTENMVTLRAAFEIGCTPSARIKVVSQSDARAVERIQAISQYILKDEDYRRVFPHIKPHPKLDWSKHKITVERPGISKDASIEAVGILSTAAGARADLIIFDDVVDARNAIQLPALRKTIKDTYKSVWTNLLDPEGGKIIYIATPWHQDDLTAELRGNPEYKVVEYPINKQLDTIWPEKWTRESLLQRKREIGSREFARAFHLIAISDEDTPIKPHWIQYWETLPTMDISGTLVMAVDAAFTERTASDYTAILIGYRDANGNFYVIDTIRFKAAMPKVVKAIKRIYEQVKPDVVSIETQGTQVGLADTVIAETSIPVKKYPHPKDKMTYVSRFAVHVENAKVFLKGERTQRILHVHPSQKNLYDEMTIFPVASNDDELDALVQAHSIAEQMVGFRGAGLRDIAGSARAARSPYSDYHDTSPNYETL